MRKLSGQEIERIVSLIREGKPLPEDYKTFLFDRKKEYELVYAGKEREEDILADTMAVPLQKVKTFRNGKDGNDWTNMLIFGDNLQVLKTLLQMKQEGKLKNADGTPGVRLVYIDPPFTTRREFKGSQDQKAYQDKIAGAVFLDFLRKRLVFLRELLSDNGSIYVHLDQRKGHYVKALMDEIFGEQNFLNEVIWCYKERERIMTFYNPKHDTILFYSKDRSSARSFNWKGASEVYSEVTRKKFKYKDEDGWYQIRGKNVQGSPVRAADGLTPDDERKYPGLTYRDYLHEREGVAPRDWWEIDIINKAAEERLCYPTQKPEELLRRIISVSSDAGDIVLDCFSGSGTTLAVAEKLNRRWVGVDCGKLAIYTMQKRLLNVSNSKDLENPKKKYGKLCKPFTLYNAGLYDYKMIKGLPWDQYRDFALKLFQCRDERHDISKIELDGYLGADSVMVFNYQKHKDAVLDRDFIDDLHKYLGPKISRRFFIIAPAASVQFLEDYIEKGKTKYFVLRIPYSIIEEIHNRGFSKIKQPVSEMDVNETVDAVGFDFIQVPTVECTYFLDEHKKADLFNQKTKECVIKIEKFESRVISRKPLAFANLETLSMVMLDSAFDGEVFDLDEVFYAEELKKDDYEVHFAENKIKGQIMIIYIDIFGNEKREIKAMSDFNGKRKR